MDPTTILFEKLAGQGLVVLLLVVAVTWMNKSNQRLIERLEAANAATGGEKEKRIGDLQSRIEHLERASEECQKDRVLLWQKIVELAGKA